MDPILWFKRRYVDADGNKYNSLQDIVVASASAIINGPITVIFIPKTSNPPSHYLRVADKVAQDDEV